MELYRNENFPVGGAGNLFVNIKKKFLIFVANIIQWIIQILFN